MTKTALIRNQYYPRPEVKDFVEFAEVPYTAVDRPQKKAISKFYLPSQVIQESILLLRRQQLDTSWTGHCRSTSAYKVWNYGLEWARSSSCDFPHFVDDRLRPLLDGKWNIDREQILEGLSTLSMI